MNCGWIRTGKKYVTSCGWNSSFIISEAVTEEMPAPSITMHKFAARGFSTGLIKAFPFICGDN